MACIFWISQLILQPLRTSNMAKRTSTTETSRLLALAKITKIYTIRHFRLPVRLFTHYSLTANYSNSCFGLRPFAPHKTAVQSRHRPSQNWFQYDFMLFRWHSSSAVCPVHTHTHIYICGVSWNGGIPKSSILIRFSIINQPFRGTPIYGNPHR